MHQIITRCDPTQVARSIRSVVGVQVHRRGNHRPGGRVSGQPGGHVGGAVPQFGRVPHASPILHPDLQPGGPSSRAARRSDRTGPVPASLKLSSARPPGHLRGQRLLRPQPVLQGLPQVRVDRSTHGSCSQGKRLPGL